jgi:hypothetical protein
MSLFEFLQSSTLKNGGKNKLDFCIHCTYGRLSEVISSRLKFSLGGYDEGGLLKTIFELVGNSKKHVDTSQFIENP